MDLYLPRKENVVESLIFLILGLAIVGAILYVIITYIPMPPLFRNVLLVVVAIAVLLWLAQYLGVFHLR